MKAMWFLPFTFAAGAEGFALFVAYLIGVFVLLYLLRLSGHAKPHLPAIPQVDQPFLPVPADVQPAL